MTARSCFKTSRLRGFSIVELMVAMTLSLILLAGALSILYSTKLTNTENERLARVQEAGRAAFELIGQDARAAGYSGCARNVPLAGLSPIQYTFQNKLTATSLLWNFTQPVYGFEATGATAWTPTIDAAIPSGAGSSPTPIFGNDILVLRAARPGSPVFRVDDPPPSRYADNADIPVDRTPGATLAPNTPVVISDCGFAYALLATGFTPTTPTATTGTISHVVLTGTPTINNVTDTLTHHFGHGSLIQPIQTVIYYVASCTAVVVGSPCDTSITPPALWMIVGAAPPQELVEGVEGMQIKYGVDTSGDLEADTYVTADAVTDWTKVVSINLAILVRSIDENGTEIDRKSYPLLGGTTGSGGATYGPFNDRRQRQIFSTTIAVRNVAP